MENLVDVTDAGEFTRLCIDKFNELVDPETNEITLDNLEKIERWYVYNAGKCLMMSKYIARKEFRELVNLLNIHMVRPDYD